MTDTRGSVSSPLWMPSLRSPNQDLSTEDQYFLIRLGSWLTFACPEKEAQSVLERAKLKSWGEHDCLHEEMWQTHLTFTLESFFTSSNLGETLLAMNVKVNSFRSCGDAGVMAREYRCPSDECVVSIPNFASWMIFFTPVDKVLSGLMSYTLTRYAPSIFSCGVRSSFVAFAT